MKLTGDEEEDNIHSIAEVAAKYNIAVLSNEIYEHIIYEGKPFSIASPPIMLDRISLLSGFSKTYAATGGALRLRN